MKFAGRCINRAGKGVKTGERGRSQRAAAAAAAELNCVVDSHGIGLGRVIYGQVVCKVCQR